MTWMPWIGHLSSKALAACDYVGESLADFLGITTPKYSYEIAEADRMKQEAEKNSNQIRRATSPHLIVIIAIIMAIIAHFRTID